MTSTQTTSQFQQIRGACPATGRSASVCDDQTHATCWVGHNASVALDRKVEKEMRRVDRSS